MSVRKLLGLVATGAVTGGLLAVVAPSQSLAASSGCKCDDWGTGSYACLSDQSGCGTGGEICQTTCRD